MGSVTLTGKEKRAIKGLAQVKKKKGRNVHRHK